MGRSLSRTCGSASEVFAITSGEAEPTSKKMSSRERERLREKKMQKNRKRKNQKEKKENECSWLGK